VPGPVRRAPTTPAPARPLRPAAPGADGSTAHLRLPDRLALPDGRHPVTLPKTDTPVVYAVVRHGALLRLDGPEYAAGAGPRILDAVAVRRIRRAR
jgi:hypothetical protein